MVKVNVPSSSVVVDGSLLSQISFEFISKHTTAFLIYPSMAVPDTVFVMVVGVSTFPSSVGVDEPPPPPQPISPNVRIGIIAKFVINS